MCSQKIMAASEVHMLLKLTINVNNDTEQAQLVKNIRYNNKKAHFTLIKRSIATMLMWLLYNCKGTDYD